MKRLIVTCMLMISTQATAGQAADFSVDPDRVTVSGLSAGGQMAHQLHIAYSDLFSGAGIISGGPFGCAQGSLVTAMARCMGTSDPALSVENLAGEIRTASQGGQLADLSALTDDEIWLFHGKLDTTVAEGVSDSLAALYAEFVPPENIRYVKDIEAAHTFPALDQGSACDSPQSPFVGDCDYDAAGDLLNHLYTGLKAPQAEAENILVTVALDGAAGAGLHETAYLFVPPACSNRENACALHLVLHGCAQSSVQVGTAFIEQSGYLGWAGNNDIVLAFPQVVPGPANPYACWDWWGYTGAEYRWREGGQMKLLADWIRDLIPDGD